MEPSRSLLCLLLGIVLPSLYRCYPTSGYPVSLGLTDAIPMDKTNVLALLTIAKLDNLPMIPPTEIDRSSGTLYDQQQQIQHQSQHSLSTGNERAARNVLENNPDLQNADEFSNDTVNRKQNQVGQDLDKKYYSDSDLLGRLLALRSEKRLRSPESRRKRWVCTPMPCCRYRNQC